MYHVFYLFTVSRDHADRFQRIARDASESYKRLGAADSVTLRITRAGREYGCVGLRDQVSIAADEQLFLGIDSFNDVAHFRSAMAKIDSDPQVIQLYQGIQEVLDLKKVVRWEAEEL